METGYLILRAGTDNGESEVWRPHAVNVQASGSEAAIKKAADGPGIYVAIPRRSFKPTTVKVETKQVVSLG